MKRHKNTSPRKQQNQTRRKTPVAVQKKPYTSKAVEEALIHFREYHPVNRFSRNLRTMLIEFLMYEGAIEVSYLQDLLYDLLGLFELLEIIHMENESEANPDN